MMPGINPKKMQAMMKQMGMSQEEIDASRVIIECEDRKIIIDEPSVVKINMQGQENFQISGDVSEVEDGEGDIVGAVEEEAEEDKSEEDIAVIVERTGVSEEEARGALEKADGDLTEALMALG
jgi:nascent polypeptide-associated complex subunit alpha